MVANNGRQVNAQQIVRESPDYFGTNARVFKANRPRPRPILVAFGYP